MDKGFWRIGKEEIEEIQKAINAGFTKGTVKVLEEAFARKMGMEYAIAVNSGNSALHCCLGALNLQPGDEVIVTPLTFIAPTFATLYTGAVPVYADIDPETFTIDPVEIEKKITKRTKAIIPVSVYGLSSDMDKIMEIAEKHNLVVIEDDAECFLGKYKGRLSGTTAHMSIFSFERSKHMTTGEGGIIVTNDRELALKIRKFSNLGYISCTPRQGESKITKKDVQHPDFKRHDSIGYNYRMSELCAAVALAQLNKLDLFVEKRKTIAAIYDKTFKNCKWLVPQLVPPQYENTYWTYVVRLDTRKISWDDFRDKFVERGGCGFFAAWSLNYLEPAMLGQEFPENKIRYIKGLCPKAEEIQPQLIQLKTNFESLDYAEKQANILKELIASLD